MVNHVYEVLSHIFSTTLYFVNIYQLVMDTKDLTTPEIVFCYVKINFRV